MIARQAAMASPRSRPGDSGRIGASASGWAASASSPTSVAAMPKDAAAKAETAAMSSPLRPSPA
ncbi:hypothetical protein Q5Y72_01430 [Paracoccus sp. 2205BS29-5]|uniref:Uncharacterized protein n=1 Tax=Paracoccus spongiarum TaxID=3064387 RepID=A0ABT9J9J9_9RHOB|nr:hypothetical protein [Paracoccus sp. 2205BS29-5]MDP5305761.1 hypothetical protein [Paracoccus sp. 2205BS29-5]